MSEKPVLTFPNEVADEVTKQYDAHSVILEYGSGGSTYLASRLQNKKIYSVESDPAWLSNLGVQIRASDPLSNPYLYYVTNILEGKARIC